MIATQLSDAIRAYNSIFNEICFGCNQKLSDFLICVSFNFSEPPFAIGKRRLVCCIKANEDTICTMLVSGRYCMETLLPGSVPDLQFDLFTIYVHRSYFESNANCSYETLRERVVCKPKQQNSFPQGRQLLGL
jgi:hypothetical protein